MAENPEAAVHRLRQGPSLTPAALGLDFGGSADLTSPAMRKRFEAMCRLAKPLTVAVLTIPAAPLGTPFDDEVGRLSGLASFAMREGLVLTVETHSPTVTADPAVAAELCKAVPGLRLTLDPSHYIQGPNQGADFDVVYPYVQNVHLRDTGRGPGEFQVRVGQGEVEYGRIVNQLARHGYDRADRLDPRPARQPVRRRGRGPQAQAPAGELDLSPAADRHRPALRKVTGTTRVAGPPWPRRTRWRL